MTRPPARAAPYDRTERCGASKVIETALRAHYANKSVIESIVRGGPPGSTLGSSSVTIRQNRPHLGRRKRRHLHELSAAGFQLFSSSRASSSTVLNPHLEA